MDYVGMWLMIMAETYVCDSHVRRLSPNGFNVLPTPVK